MPVCLQILAVIALTLYILFGYLIVPPEPTSKYFRCIVSIIVIVIVLLLWFVLPVRVG